MIADFSRKFEESKLSHVKTYPIPNAGIAPSATTRTNQAYFSSANKLRKLRIFRLWNEVGNGLKLAQNTSQKRFGFGCRKSPGIGSKAGGVWGQIASGKRSEMGRFLRCAFGPLPGPILNRSKTVTQPKT